MYSNGRCGGGISHSNQPASAKNPSKPPAAGAARLNFSVTTPF
jgi:hypothetical protein